jgi:two-component system CheB/CheR fusion protein
VLVIDDDPPSVETLRRLLETEGMKVVQAANAAEALEQAAKAPFDVVICDIAMPKMDGYGFIRTLRRREGGADVPVIAVTGLGRPADIKRALDAGFRLHLTKPISLDRLLAALDNVLGAPLPRAAVR